MPKISVRRWQGMYQVRFEWPDLDTKIFGFATMEAAQQAIELARFVQLNDIALTDIHYT